MRFALFLGCTIPTEQYAYEMSVRETFPKLGIELAYLKDVNCCGFPVFRSINSLVWLYLSAKDLALSEEQGLDLFTPCNGCNMSLSETKHYLEENPFLKEKINALLAKEGLEYHGKVKVFHTLDILHDIVGVEKIRTLVRRPFSKLKLASHYGCHIIRPSNIKRPDDAYEPHKLEDLIEALGAESPGYPERLDCCGSGLAVVEGRTTLSIAGTKLKAVHDYGFDGIVMICPFCMKIFDARQEAIKAHIKDKSIDLPAIYYTQLLGLSMGLNPTSLGLNLNRSPVDRILNKLGGQRS